MKQIPPIENMISALIDISKTTLVFARANILATCGVLGIITAIAFSFSKGKLPDIPANQMSLPASSPFKHAIAGIGFVEANSRNIDVGTFTSGIVQKIYVKEGDVVEAKAPLFELDTRSAILQVTIDEHEIKALEQCVEAAKATYGYAEDLHNRDQKLKDGVKSRSDIKKVEFEFQKALADLNTQKIKLEQARSKHALSMVALDKLIVKAPVAGIILKTYVNEGEYINENTQTPIMTMGNHKPLYVRVQIDENDVWRYEHKAKAVGFLRSNAADGYLLTCVRFEPYAMPKNQLSGNSKELIDTRIIEIVYKIENTHDDVLIGQQMDVFIETSKAG
ncbi:MAG: HlyD family efflux transporter periplasmic adaptor subunit [Pseudomonadota bacterium]